MVQENTMQVFMIILGLPNFLAGGLFSPQAYIDPNTGGMLFQILAALLAVFSGILFFFSRQIKTLFARLRRKVRGDEEQAAEDLDKPEP
jgi:hypothetical protein